MSNRNNICNDISNTDEINHDNINGFNHCENIIESKNLFDHIINICNISKHEKILEFGCGSGRIGQYFVKNDYDYYGIDKSSNMIKKFIELLNYNKVDIINSFVLPFPDNYFDIVLCYSIIQYLNNMDEFEMLLNEFIRISKRIIYIGDLESIDHSENNKKNNDLKHLIIKKEYLESLNIKYKLNFSSEYCSRSNRYNILIDKNDYIFGYKIIENIIDEELLSDCKKEIFKLINEPDKKMYIWKYYENKSENISRIEYFVNYSKFFYELASNKLIIDQVKILMNEDPILFKDKINLKYPNSEGFEPHQDSAAMWNKYSNKLITVAITINNLNVDNGTLYFSNKKSKQITEDLTNLNINNFKFNSINLLKNNLLLFDCFIPHMSYKNNSNDINPVIYFTYSPKSEGDYYEKYHVDKFKNNPPDIYKDKNKKYYSNNTFIKK